MDLKTPTVGMSFRTFQKAEEYVYEYMQHTNQIFVKRNTKKCSSTCKIKTKLKSDIVYHEIEFVCKHGRCTHVSEGKIRKRRSLKVQCPARIRLQASRNGQLLQICRVELEHKNHLNTKLDPVPESRKLNETQFKFILNALKLKSNRPCLISVLKEEFGVTVTAKDLKNIQSKIRITEKDQLSTTISFLQEKGARIDILKEGNVFQGLFFTTPDMQASVTAWPETIYFDGTYKLLMHSLIVILFLVEDGNFLTELAAVAIVRREDQATIDWVINCFAKHHSDNVKMIRYFMCDKNATQRNSVNKIFPSAKLLICLFHTLQIFKRTIASMKELSAELKEISLKQLTKMCYVENEQQYKERLNKMIRKCPPSVLSYFFKNWDCIKTEWTCYNENIGTFYNRTNNRTESINQKLKQIINKLSNLYQTVNLFFTWKDFHDNENKRKIIRNFGSELPRQFNEVESQYVNLLMDGPSEIVLEELQSMNYVNFDEQNKSDDIFCIYKSNRKTSTKECNCGIRIAYILPCRHMFAARSLMKYKLYDDTLCNKRWTKNFCLESHRIFMRERRNTEVIPVTLCEKIHNIENEIELRLIKITEIISDIIDICSCKCGDKFYEQFALLTDLMEIWSKDVNLSISVKEKIGNEIYVDNFEVISNKM